MSSVIELYEHNQKAYDALLDMLGERDRACVIKPTGTGKFVIIAKMVQDNPDKRFLLLGTNDYMFNDQMANLAEIAPGFTPENLQFMTYAAAMGMERRNDCVPPYDVIIADEFHHCGAEEWGKGVTHILNANERQGGRIHCHPYPLLGWWKEYGGRDVRRKRGLFHGAGGSVAAWDTADSEIRHRFL